MTDFKNAIIFGLAVENSLNELTVDPNTALRNLNLIPADFNKLRRIGSDSAGIGKTFQRLSGLNENLLLKLDSLKSETREYDGVLDEIYEARARRSRRQKIQPIQGNLNVNGKLSGRTVSYRVFDEETSSFKTVPITTAINSAWDELGTSIFLGSSLKIASTNASPGNPLVKTGKLKNLQTFTQRRFLAEKATHKIAIKVDGVQYYMYAIKNNPFVFTGNFKNIVGESADNDANILLTVSDSSTINYVTAIVDINGNEIEVSTQNQNNISNLVNGTVLKIYTDPQKVTNLKLTGHEIEELPPGVIFSNASGVDCNLKDNSFTTFPDLKKQFPNFKKFNLSQDVNKTSNGQGPIVKMDIEFAELKSKLPNDITELNLGNAFIDFDAATSDSPLAPNEFNLAPFDKLTVLNLSRCGTGEGAGSFPTPAISTTVETLRLNKNSYSLLDEATLPAGNSLKIINLEDNEKLVTTPDSPPIHKFYVNGTYSNDLEEMDVGTTKLGIPNLSGKTNLKNFYGDNMKYDENTPPNSPGEGEFNDERFQLAPNQISKFVNCTALKSITLNNSDVHGPIPSFASNSALTDVDLSNTNLINWGYDTPVSLALPDECFHPTMNNFQYVYNHSRNIDGQPNDSPPMTNEFPPLAFQYSDSLVSTTSDTGYFRVPFNTFTWKSRKVTTGVFPQIDAVNINIVGNRFTSLTPFGTESASRLEKLEAQDNELTGELNLDNLFFGGAGIEYTELTKLNFSSNKFTSMAPNSIPVSKFSALENLILDSAFDSAIADSPPTLHLPAFKNSSLKTIEVSNNSFDTIEDNLFSGGESAECTSLTNFTIDETDFAKVSSIITSATLLQAGKTTTRSLNFSTNPAARLDIRIPSFKAKRTYTAQDRNFFNMHEDIQALKAKNVSVDGIIQDLDGEQSYADIPSIPLNVTLQRFTNPGDNNLRISFDRITDADRVIIKVHTQDTPNEEFVGNATLEGINVFNQTSAATQTLDITGDNRLLEGQPDGIIKVEIFGENIRSIISNLHNVREVFLSADSPPEYGAV